MFRFRKLLSLTTALLLLCTLLTGCGQKKDVTELKSGTGTASISDVAVTDGQLTAAITVSDLSFAFLNDEACSNLAAWKVFRPYLEFSDGSTVRLATSGGGMRYTEDADGNPTEVTITLNVDDYIQQKLDAGLCQPLKIHIGFFEEPFVLYHLSNT